MSIASVMPANHLILCRPLLLLPSIFPSIRVFSNESVLRIRWPKYWSFGFSISPSNEYSGWLPLGWTGWISLQSKGLSRVFSNTTVQKHQFFGAQLSLYMTTGKTKTLTRWTFVGKVISLLFNMLSRLFYSFSSKQKAISSSRGSLQPRDWTCVSCTAGGFFTQWVIGKPLNDYNKHYLSILLLTDLEVIFNILSLWMLLKFTSLIYMRKLILESFSGAYTQKRIPGVVGRSWASSILSLKGCE